MKANFLQKIFSVPNYLSLQSAGIEICNDSIKYVEFCKKNSEFSIKNFGEVKLDQNVFKDGDILNKPALVKALSEVRENIYSDFVKVSIPEEKTYIFDIQLPKEAKANIREALEFKIEENVPLKLDESLFEYEIIDEGKASKDMTVGLSVIPKRVIADYTDVFEQSFLYPISFEIESKMIANSVVENGDRRNFLIVNIKDDSTLLIAVVDGFVRITSILSVGESAIRENLLKAGVFGDEKSIDSFLAGDFSSEAAQNNDSYTSLINIFSIFKDEVEKFNAYIVEKFPHSKISPKDGMDNIILCGRSAILPGLAKHINQNINAEVILANTLVNAFNVKECVSKMKFNESLSFVTPIGLVVSSYKQINA